MKKAAAKTRRIEASVGCSRVKDVNGTSYLIGTRPDDTRETLLARAADFYEVEMAEIVRFAKEELPAEPVRCWLYGARGRKN